MSADFSNKFIRNYIQEEEKLKFQNNKTKTQFEN